MSDRSVTPNKRNKNTPSATPKIEISYEYDREKMISEAAYFRSEHRNFEGENSINDWLVSEAEIDEVIKNH